MTGSAGIMTPVRKTTGKKPVAKKAVAKKKKAVAKKKVAAKRGPKSDVRDQIRKFLQENPTKTLGELRDRMVKKFPKRKTLKKDYHQYVSPIRRELVLAGKVKPLNGSERSIGYLVRALAKTGKSAGAIRETVNKLFSSKQLKGKSVTQIITTVMKEVERSGKLRVGAKVKNKKRKVVAKKKK